MLTRWKKLNVVHGFLNLFNDDIRLNWCHSIDQTYDDILAGKYGQVKKDGQHYILMVNNMPFMWSEQ